MAGFEVSTYGRIWVSTEAITTRCTMRYALLPTFTLQAMTMKNTAFFRGTSLPTFPIGMPGAISSKVPGSSEIKRTTTRFRKARRLGETWR